MLGFVLLVLLRYVVDYANAAKSLQVVVLLAGIVMGKGVALWVAWAKRPLTPSLSPSEGERVSAGRVRGILSILVFLLAVAALWQPEIGMEFHYRGIPRWKGVWDNPNTYGLLMGVGAILAVGLLVPSSRFQSPNCGSAACRFLSPVTRHWPLALLFVAASLCGLGLLKSYSRGAWLGTALGIGFSLGRWIRRTHLPMNLAQRLGTDQDASSSNSNLCPPLIFGCLSWLFRNWRSAVILVISGFVICFWQFRHTESPLLRRVFSVGNVNDFSWRNRVTAWQGAGRMMRDKPLVGFGWGKAEEVYRQEYRAERLEETAAIQLNDYLMIGISVGTPAVLCLLVYVGLALVRKEECGARTSNEQLADKAVRAPGQFGAHGEARPASMLNFQLSTAAMAGAFVLLIGFWFDGGLFKLPTGVVFWVLLELARSSFPERRSPDRPGVEFVPRRADQVIGAPSSAGRAQVILSWLAGVVAVLAIGQTVVHQGVPQLAVSQKTLSIARHWLVPARERADFEFLAAKPIWPGKPLKVLLQHAHLANYNRELVNWKVEDAVYRTFVLPPEIDPAFDGDLNWRRSLWEYFYPRIRKETSLAAAAETVERQSRERVKIVSMEDAPKTIPEMWQRELASQQGFETICVAAWRSVGIPARLSASGQAEFWSGDEWKSASRNPAH
ncbi:MAG TPA: O-antigen ligase family protein [Verrucomicrobiae bacterium]|nr:O-antigen ligase family protein [Verrucomicrobiae bacterium]